jgi:hypothetical protein
MEIRVYSRQDIEQGILMGLQEAQEGIRLACISITDPGARPARIWSHQLRASSMKLRRLQFHDVNPRIEANSYGVYRAMTPDHALKVVDFLNECRDQVDLLAVHCEAGISRSAAVAAACAKILGQNYDIFFRRPYQANLHCYELVLSAAGMPLPGASEKWQNLVKTAADYPDNLDAPVLEVRHADLTRQSGDSRYRSVCPVCLEGLLLVQRDDTSFVLREFDNCILCGQRVRYLDIEELRQRELGQEKEQPLDNGVVSIYGAVFK